MMIFVLVSKKVENYIYPSNQTQQKRSAFASSVMECHGAIGATLRPEISAGQPGRSLS